MYTIKITNTIELNFAKQILNWLFSNDNDSLLIVELMDAINEYEHSEDYTSE
jgi:hypothetical protein